MLFSSMLSQLLQENLGTNQYVNSSNWIHPDAGIRKMLLSVGQGGPYQINDYAKRLSSGYGMINFTTLQKNLGYTVVEQDSGAQNKTIGPPLLYDKYFGPVAAAYFQYNGSVLRVHKINQDTWGPQYANYNSMLPKVANDDDNFLDMIWNAAYNAGPWSPIMTSYVELGANVDNPDYINRIKNINNYHLTDNEYREAIGTNQAANTTFIIYPRQVRHYLDQLYNNNQDTGLNTSSSLIFDLKELQGVFSKVMATLGYVNSSNNYVLIPESDSVKAYNEALASNGLSVNDSLNVSTKADRTQIFSLLELSLTKLSANLNFNFGELVEETLTN
jgi:hypothetical protein